METNPQNPPNKKPTSRYDRALVYGQRETTMQRYFKMFYMFADQNMDVREIAAEMGCSTSTVYQALETVEKKIMGAPDNVKSGTLARHRRNQHQELMKLYQTKIDQLERIDTAADDFLQEHIKAAKDANMPLSEKAVAMFIRMRLLGKEYTNTAAELLEKSRRQDYDLALFWGVLQRSGLTVNFNTQIVNQIDGNERAELAKMIDELSTPPQNEPDPEYRHRSAVDTN